MRSRPGRRSAVLRRTILALLVTSSTGFAAGPAHLDSFESGLRAMRYRSWSEAVFWFELALAAKSRPGGTPGRVSGRNYAPYFPRYYLGLALYELGRYDSALAALATSELEWAAEPDRFHEAGMAPYRNESREITNDVRRRFAWTWSRLGRQLDELDQRLRALPSGVREGGPGSASNLAGEATVLERRLRSVRQEHAAIAEAGSFEALERVAGRLGDIAARLDALEAGRSSAARIGGAAPAILRYGDFVGGRAGSTPTAFALASSSVVAHLAAEEAQGEDLRRVLCAYHRRYALLIAPRYADPANRSKSRNVEATVAELADALRARDYEVRVLSGDADTHAVTEELDRLRKLLVADSERGDKSFAWVHFVGHAVVKDVNGQDSLLLLLNSAPPPQALIDAPKKTDREAQMKKLYQNRAVLSVDSFEPLLLKGVETKSHVLLSVESCFAGRFLEQLAPGGYARKEWRKALAQPAFVVWRAGDQDQVIPDSALLRFTEMIAGYLTGARLGERPFLSGWEVFTELDAELYRSAGLTPQPAKYATGDFRDGDVFLGSSRCPAP